jgi:hypothetical protein
MKMKLVALSAVMFLASCDQIGKQALNSLPDPSQEQEAAAQTAYDHLRHAEFDALAENFSPALNAKFNANGKELKRFAKQLPKEDYKSKKIVSKHIADGTNQPSEYTVSYEYGYPKNLVQYDVSFDKAGGSSKIQDINIQIFGE